MKEPSKLKTKLGFLTHKCVAWSKSRTAFPEIGDTTLPNIYCDGCPRYLKPYRKPQYKLLHHYELIDPRKKKE